MRWFEEHIGRVLGRDRGEPVASCDDIARVASQALDNATMARFVREYFPTQKALSSFLGVRDSTVTGWVKSRSFPDYAKRAILAAYYSEKHLRQVDAARRDATRHKVAKDEDGDHYLIVQFGEADNHGVAVGRVLESGIPTKKEALASVAARLALDILGEHEERLRNEIENVSVLADKKHLRDLVDAFGLDRERVKHHFRLEGERPVFEAATNVPDVHHTGSTAETDDSTKEVVQ